MLRRERRVDGLLEEGVLVGQEFEGEIGQYGIADLDSLQPGRGAEPVEDGHIVVRIKDHAAA